MHSRRVTALTHTPVRLLALAWLAAACSVAAPTSRPPSTPPAGGPLDSPAVSEAPFATASATPRNTQPAASASPADSSALPPLATLASGGTPALPGWQGSYCWRSSCVDMAGLPPKSALPQIDIGAADQLQLGLEPMGSFTTWSAAYGDAGTDDLITLGNGGQAYDPDASATPLTLSSAVFDPPPPGDWYLVISIHFVAGDGAYAWHAIVH